MGKRFVSVWFSYLITDWFALRRPELLHKAFVVTTQSHGRMIVTAVNAVAAQQGIYKGMVLADARALCHGLEAIDEVPDLAGRLLKRIAEWCIRFTPVAAVDLPDGLILDASGCPHLWGGEQAYINDIITRLQARGYQTRAAMADTIGAAWAVARFGSQAVIEAQRHTQALLPLPAAALRLDLSTLERLGKLGLRQIKDFINIPAYTLRRRFGATVVTHLNQALGHEEEFIIPVQPVAPYHERLPCLEPVVTATGINIALQRLLEALCQRLSKEEKGLRIAIFKCYRVDGKTEQVQIATTSPSHSVKHLHKLFETKLSLIEPTLGIELFVLEASSVEAQAPAQQKLWETRWSLDHICLSELIDRLAVKTGNQSIRRFLPAEHHLPERSVQQAASIYQPKESQWLSGNLRPIQLLPVPEKIEVTSPIPDYPPMLFRYRGKLHRVKKADGPERIEQEWWIQDGRHRDYYAVEDDEGHRYWVFRLGHYNEDYQWFLHGVFA